MHKKNARTNRCTRVYWCVLEVHKKYHGLEPLKLHKQSMMYILFVAQRTNNFTYAPSGRNVTTHHSATPAELSHLVSLHIHIRPMRLDIKDRCARLPRRAKHTKHRLPRRAKHTKHRLPRRAKHTKHRLLNRAKHTQHRCYEVTHRRQPKR